MFKWGMSLEEKIWKNLQFPWQLSPKNFNKTSFQISPQKLIKGYLVQEIEMLNQLLGTREKS